MAEYTADTGTMFNMNSGSGYSLPQTSSGGGSMALTAIGVTGAVLGGAGAIASAFQSAPGGPRTPELPPELEAPQLESLVQTRDMLRKQISRYDELIPQVEKRVNLMFDMQKGVMPEADAIKALNDMDQSIAAQFGPGTLRDIQSNMISDATRKQAQSIQEQVAKYMAQEGNAPDANMNALIQEAVRKQFADGSSFNQSFDTIAQTALGRINELAATEDPAVTRQLKEQEVQLRDQLRRQYGSGYEQTEAGRRALNDFRQMSAETQFTTREQLKTSSANRLATLSGIAQGAQLGKIQGLSGLASLSQQGQAIQSGVYSRLGALSDLNISQANANTAAGEAGRQNAQIALAASNQQRNAFQTGLAGLSGLTGQGAQLSTQLMEGQTNTAAAQMNLFRQMAEQKISKQTKKAMETGNVNGIEGRSDIYNSYYDPQVQAQTKSTAVGGLSYEDLLKELNKRNQANNGMYTSSMAK